MPVTSGPARARQSIDDFELVRNGEGQWLLVLPESLPHAAADPAHTLNARLVDDELILQQPPGDIFLRSLVAGHYLQGLKADKPAEIILCVVDDDGVRRLLRKIPLFL